MFLIITKIKGNKNYIPKNTNLMLLMILTVWILFASKFGGRTDYFVTDNFIIIPVCAAMIWICATAKSGIAYKILNRRELVFLGEASYAMYIMQFLPLFASPWLVRHYDTFSQHHLYLWAVIIPCTMVLAILAHLYIEKPFRMKIINRYKHKAGESKRIGELYSSN